MLTGCWEMKHWGKLAVVFVMTVLKQKRGMIQTHVETWSSSELFFSVLAYACSLMYCRLHNQVETQRHSKIAALNQLSRHTYAQGVKSSSERNFSCTICHNALQKWLKHVSHMVKFLKSPSAGATFFGSCTHWKSVSPLLMWSFWMSCDRTCWFPINLVWW